jgi:hypothetical protein
VTPSDGLGPNSSPNNCWDWLNASDSIGRKTIASVGPYGVELYLRGLKAAGLSEASVAIPGPSCTGRAGWSGKWSGDVLPNPVAGTEMPD